jgi:ADP-heptose:LPS heptosyltransferase
MRIIVSAYTGLGNFILKTPLIQALAKEYPGCHIDLLFGYPWGAENVLAGSELINKKYWLTPQSTFLIKLSFFKMLSRNKYDLVILPFESSPIFVLLLSQLYLRKSKIISHIGLHDARIKIRLRNIFYIMLLVNIKWVPTLKGRHEIDLNLDLLQDVIKNKISRDYETFICWKNEDVSNFDLNQSYIVIQPSAANGSLTPKIWDPRNFDELIRKFLLIYPTMKVILVGDSGDASEFNESKMLTNNSTINLLGKTSFNQLCTILNKAKAVITHDSGIMHVANALQVPLIALYGPTDYTRTAPLALTSISLHSHNKCWRTMVFGFKGSEADLAKHYQNYYCMSGITVDQVMTALVIMINKCSKEM